MKITDPGKCNISKAKLAEMEKFFREKIKKIVSVIREKVVLILLIFELSFTFSILF